ncbi:MAG: FAD:protein FMN transferase [Sulfuricurvum sp.]|nr:FAD:protein FMN transferase [Sulfuricurvum sp.]
MKLLCLLLTISSLLWGNQRTQAHMGTLISVNVTDENLSDDVFAVFSDLDNRLSTYKSDSEISHLNRNLECNVSEMTRQILQRSIEMYHLSEGAFDITVGSFTHNAYRFGYENERLPSSQELKNAEKLVDSNRIILLGNTIQILPGTVIDLGGIGKGYAVDVAVNLLKTAGITTAVVAASGDIGCLGECVINIQDPFHPQGYISTITSTLPRFAISTSGNYERYIKNKAHNHLIDPKTGKSQQRYASITLVDIGDNTRIDALATAVSIMDEAKAIDMLKKLNISYLLIRTDGTMIKSQMPQGVLLSL